MHISTELFLAWKYFKPKRSAVSIITLISVVGVGLGVAVLIVVLAVMTGFTDELKEKLLETGAHAQVQKNIVYSVDNRRGQAGTYTEDEMQVLADEASSLGADPIPVLTSPVLLQVGDNFNPKALIAFDPRYAEAADKRFKFKDVILAGSYPLKRNEVAVSSVIADEFKLALGDKILLHSPSKLAHLIRKDENGRYMAADDAQYYLPGEYVVSAVYKFGKYDFDKNMLFMNLDDADELFGLDWGTSTQLYIWVDDPFHMDDFLTRFHAKLQSISPDSNVYSWRQIHSQILGVLSMEKNMMFFLLIFIVLVAAFSITNTLITTVIQKTREIGLLKSMGATSGVILRIFLMQGLFVGLIGTAFGVITGFLVIQFRMNILDSMRKISGQNVFPAEVYFFDKLSAHIVWSDVGLICIISILLCTAGALVPAFRAAKLDPARALRYE